MSQTNDSKSETRTPEVPGPFPVGTRVRSTSHDQHGVVVGDLRRVLFDGYIPEYPVDVADLFEVEPAGPKPEPTPKSPVTHQWAVGDRVRPNNGAHVFCVSVGTISGSVGSGDSARYNIDLGSRWGTSATADQMELIEAAKVEPSPVPQPEPDPAPATTLYRVEYPVTDQSIDIDGQGNWLDPTLVTSRRAALIPIAGIADRLRWAKLLEVMHDLEGNDDQFAVAQLGGCPADPYAVGDRVTILGGGHEGEAWYLVERDESNGQRWWVSKAKGEGNCDGSEWAMLGLHFDHFERDERGDS